MLVAAPASATCLDGLTDARLRALVDWTAAQMDLPSGAPLPIVRCATEREIRAKGGMNATGEGMYTSDSYTIWLSTSKDNLKVHEIVHHLQHLHGIGKTRLEREIQAKTIERIWADAVR